MNRETMSLFRWLPPVQFLAAFKQQFPLFHRVSWDFQQNRYAIPGELPSPLAITSTTHCDATFAGRRKDARESCSEHARMVQRSGPEGVSF